MTRSPREGAGCCRPRRILRGASGGRGESRPQRLDCCPGGSLGAAGNGGGDKGQGQGGCQPHAPPRRELRARVRLVRVPKPGAVFSALPVV